MNIVCQKTAFDCIAQIEFVNTISMSALKCFLGIISCRSSNTKVDSVCKAIMPRRLGRGKPKEKKVILLPEQAKKLLEQARNDRDYGIYYAFPFLTGVRPSEQLGLLWEVVDFEKRTIRICRMQEQDGSISNITKTAAGTRTIPMSNMLYEMLLDWRERCPRREGVPYRVFPNIGHMRHKPVPRTGGGNCLLYSNFRTRVWHPALKKAGLPHVTPHSARHFFISTLQAQGIEVGLVAKLAGHANATITLSHYTQAVRGGEEAVEALAKVFQSAGANNMAEDKAA
ncbi:MAG: site-specific integrase [Bdellovibrionales bacterium]